MVKHKLAIISSGGGMRCSYGAGVMQALVERWGVKSPAFVLGGSGSAGTLAYFSAGQFDAIRDVWTKHLSNKNIVKLTRVWKMLDIDYMIDTVFKKNYPLDVMSFAKSKIKCLIAATNYRTGEAEYFSNKHANVIYQILKATKAIPLFFNRNVRIGNDNYCDSNISSSIALHIEEAIKQGATKLIVIDNSSVGRIQPLMHSAWARLRKKQFKKTYHKKLRELKQMTIPKNVEIMKFRAHELPVPAISTNSSLLRQTFEKGYLDAVARTELKNFLQNTQY